MTTPSHHANDVNLSGSLALTHTWTHARRKSNPYPLTPTRSSHGYQTTGTHRMLQGRDPYSLFENETLTAFAPEGKTERG